MSCPSGKTVVVSEAFQQEADAIVARYPVSKRSAVLMLLHQWQEAHGHISEHAITWIARRLDLQEINVLEVVTFYPMFRQHPAGQVQFKVCRTLPCMLGGSYELYDHLKKRCGVGEPDEHGLAVSPDGQFSVEFVECLASCGTAPVMMVNDDFYEGVTLTKADELVKHS
jgi:NADH-quinone oxidoreductase subunit E